MSVKPSPVLLKVLGMMDHHGKNGSSGLTFKHGNIAFTNSIHATKLFYQTLLPSYYALTPLWKPC